MATTLNLQRTRPQRQQGKTLELHVPWTVIREEAYKEYERNSPKRGEKRDWYTAETRLCLQQIGDAIGRAVTSPPERRDPPPKLCLVVEGEEGMIKFVTTVERVVRDLQGELVGCIEAPASDALRVKLSPPWEHIAEAINGDVHEGIPLPTPDHQSLVVTGSTEAEISAIVHAIRVLSERKLRVTKEVATAPEG